MKVLVVLAVLVACAQAGTVSNIAQKLIPSFSTGFVIKGHDAVPHSAPYIVSLSRTTNHSHICGGTIIAKDWVLTAAHCISNPVGMGVVAGLHERLNIDNKTQSREVDWGKVHEKYTGGVGPYDIAILHLSEPLEYNQYVQPASLPAVEEIHSGETHLYGWGQPKAFVLTGSKILQTVESEIVEFNACKAALPEDAPIHETNICSDSMQKGISACNGDSGGPLVIEREGAPSELIGIVSWGYIPCGLANLPSIYTRVSAYIEWVAKIQNAYYVLH
ncbi:lectizyme-like [Lucilia sericata]|uniref:lectizyme-like n=1 Tax=Lucilia sericata TaxID=13632 RepID=UPI0018A81EE9|nr:lectizyme-like [Lucilia sericata]